MEYNGNRSQRLPDYFRYRIVLVSVLIIFAALVGIALWTNYSTQMQVRNTARDLFAGESAKRAMAVSFFFSNRVAELGNLASSSSVRSLITEYDESRLDNRDLEQGLVNHVCTRVFETLAERYSGDELVYARIVILSSDGHTLIDSDGECLIAGGDTQFSRYGIKYGGAGFHVGLADGVMALVISIPVIGSDGNTGTIVGWVRLESLYKGLGDMTISPSVGNDYLRIGQTIVAISDNSAQQSGQMLLMDALKDWQGLTVLKAGKSGRKVNYLAISSPVHETSMSIISLVEENRIFGAVGIRVQVLISLFIFAVVTGGCYFLVRVIFTRQIYETRIFEAAKREAAVSRQKAKLEQEIKSRRLADALRKRAEIKFRDIFDNAPVGIFQVTLDGRYLTANNALAGIFGYDGQEDLVASVRDVRSDIFVNPEDWGKGLAILRLHGQVDGYEVKCKRKDGESIWTARNFRMVEAEPGLPPYIEGFVIDISTRKRAQESLIKSERRLRTLFDDSPVALWELDLSRLKAAFDACGIDDGVFRIREGLLTNRLDVAECIGLVKTLDVNNLAIRFLGAESREALLDSGIAPFVTERSWRFFRTILLDFASGATRHRSEFQFVREDGKDQFLIVNCSIVPGEENSWGRVLATIEDISELKRIETELRISKEEAQKANEAKGHFLANMSHEFRTPMNAIKGMVQLLQGSDLSAEQQENLRLIKSSVDSLLVIVNDILDFSKLDSVHMELNEESLDLPAFLKEMRDVMDIGAMNKRLQVELVTENIPTCVRVDSLRLRQVLVNLLGNAVKFTDEGTVTLKCSVFSESVTRPHLLFEVLDTGIGLPIDGVESLFKSFVQADPTITRRYGGTGLGLAICYKLVKLLGGELIAKNRTGGGAAFSFVLPLDVCNVESGAANGELQPEAEDKKVDYSTIKVLVAEDSRMNQILLRKVFEKNGLKNYQVVENGKDAVDTFAESQDFDIIFMDIQMPVMDGFEASRAIRKLHSPVRIVALTANSGHDFWEKCEESGMDARIIKPFNVEELLGELGKVSKG